MRSFQKAPPNQPGHKPQTTRPRAVGATYSTARFPLLQHQMIDWLTIAGRQHTMHALVELDVTDARRAIRDHRARTGEPLSFTGLVVASLARAIDEDKGMQAMRQGRSRLVVFDDVDVTVAVESDVEETKIPVPHIIRAANRKDAVQISRAIRSAQVTDVPYAAARRLLPVWLVLPGFLRRFLWTRWLADPARRKRLTGTTFVTSVGMFGRGTAWGIPYGLNYPVGLTVGGIARKPGVVGTRGGGDGEGERVEVREYLSLTISLDHDVIDGAPAARFANRLKELIEGGCVPLLGDGAVDGGASSRP